MQPVNDTRRENLRIVIRDYFPSGRQLAQQIGVHPNSISRLSNQNPRDRRNMGDEMARSIERAAGLPAGWMDVQHAEPVAPDTQYAAADKAPETAMSIAETFDRGREILVSLSSMTYADRVIVIEQAARQLTSRDKLRLARRLIEDVECGLEQF